MSHRVREYLEEKEFSLSPYAARSRSSRGRANPEEPSSMRTGFQRDRDRIVHCNAFRRLKHKTQVFISPTGDHYVTRLTHTLEVSQIARSISRALNLNEDLTEAISLGHDLGHTPFGHIGEEVLNRLHPQGFRHNEQSLRVVDILENDGKGLNLTWEVRDGILNHSKTRSEIFGEGWGLVATLEGEVCKIADSVAYINHDIGDAIRAGMIAEDDLPAKATALLGHSSSERINSMVVDIVDYSWAATGMVKDLQSPEIRMTPGFVDAANELRDFLFARVYNVQAVRAEAERARKVVEFLYDYFKEHPGELPEEYTRRGDAVEKAVVDYVAGMTDNFALQQAQKLSANA